jgi:gluconolactonase
MLIRTKDEYANAAAVARIRSCTGLLTTNLVYGRPDRRSLFITESETGTILVGKAPAPGRALAAQA